MTIIRFPRRPTEDGLSWIVRTARVVLQENKGGLAPGGEDCLRAFFRLLQAKGRDHIVTGDSPVDLAPVGF